MRKNRLLATATIVIGALGANAQEDIEVLTVDSEKGRVMVVPLLESSGPGSMDIADVRIEMAVEDGFRVYRAHHKGRTRTVHESIEGRSRRFAYDPKRGRFEEVSSTLRVRLVDDDRLDEVIAAAGAIGGKSYPALGWASIRLPDHANPAEVALALSENPLVTRAEVRLRGPILVPQ